jgi:hypothetical protein
MSPAHFHQYHQSLVYKLLVATVNGKVHLDPDQVLEVVKEIHRITCGVKQILYLAGWQFDGHDTGYPSWSETNPRLRCGGDANGHESLLRLMREAKAFNAVVSVHVNMSDAYEHSPLWEIYRKEDLLIRDTEGRLLKGGVWDPGQSYLVSKKREWESGFAKKRIDELFTHLPLADVRTVHIDAFEPRADPYHQVSLDEDAEAMAHILEYWISKGVDVTTEWFHPRFAGLTPMVWHLNTEEADRLKYPASLLCGGGSFWNFRSRPWTLDTWGANWIRQPGAGCLYERAWGEGLSYEFTKPGITPDLVDGLCLRFLPWCFLNRLTIISHVHTPVSYDVLYSENVVAEVRDDGKSFRLSQGDRVIVDNDDVCMQPAWLENVLWAYSRHGMRREWLLPERWKGIGSASMAALAGPPGPERHLRIQNGRVLLEVSAGEAVVLSPH